VPKQLLKNKFLTYIGQILLQDLSVIWSIWSMTFWVSISQVIGCEERLRNDLLCVRWGVKLYALTHYDFLDPLLFLFLESIP